MREFTIKNLVETYGLKNLVFVFETEVFDSSTLSICEGLHLPFAFTSGETIRHPMVITETNGHQDKIGYSHKVTFRSLSDSIAVPLARFYVSDFESRIKNGNVSIFKLTPDGMEPIFTMLQDIGNEQEKKAMTYVEGNFFLLQPFIGEMKTEWNQ